MEVFGQFCFAVLSTIIGVCLRGYVLSKMWFWFIATTFGIRAITIQEALGLSLIFGFLTINIKRNDKSNDGKTFENMIVQFIINIIIALLGLLFGWILYTFF